VLGLTFKENCPDIRNTRVIDVVHELKSYGIDVHVHDPVPDAGETRHEYGLELEPWDALPRADALVVAVAHRQFVARPLADYLAKVVERLEGGGLSLEESIAAFEEGIQLARAGAAKLEEAERKVELLLENDRTAPFGADDGSRR